MSRLTWLIICWIDLWPGCSSCCPSVPLQAFLLRKLKIGGSMGMALKLQPILDAAAPKSKM